VVWNFKNHSLKEVNKCKVIANRLFQKLIKHNLIANDREKYMIITQEALDEVSESEIFDSIKSK
jgi:hypothetical protein